MSLLFSFTSPKEPISQRNRLPARARRWTATATLLAATALGSALPTSASAFDLATATVADVHAAFKEGSLTSEKLTQLYLARIAAYDQQGPTINSVITLNAEALALAKTLDAEFKAGKIRGPLHGIPVLLKDNIDTFDLPTTGGSQLLAGSLPPDDAYITKKLRDAGAIILAKVNLSEWAGSGGSVSGVSDPEITKAARVPNGFSSMGGQTRNPHDLTRGPAGSSGGTGAAVAAVFGQIGLGTDTGGSVRGPSTANGIVGLKPTKGLMSRDGIIPLALSYDTAGPMARSVYDVALALGVMTGVDKADEATAASAGEFKTDYIQYLKKGSLKGARIGIARDFMGKDPEVDRVVEESIVTLKKLGAVIVDPIKYPDYILLGKQNTYSMLVMAEFKAQVTEYLKTTAPQYPKSYDDLVTLSNDPKTGYRSPGKAFGLKYNQTRSLELTDPQYLALKGPQLASVKAAILALFEKHNLDAIIYPTSPRPATLINPPTPPAGGGSDSATNIANFTGFPDLIVTAGMTKDGLPVAISFFGKAWSEPKLFGYGYDFEQATKAVVLPKHTPALAGDKF